MSKFVQKAANLGLPSWSPVTIGTINFLLVQVATQFKYTMSDFMSRNENKSKKPGVRHRAQAPTDKKVWSRRWKTTSTPTPPPGNQNLVVRGIFWKTTWYFEIIFRKNNSQFNFFYDNQFIHLLFVKAEVTIKEEFLSNLHRSWRRRLLCNRNASHACEIDLIQPSKIVS